MMNMKLLEVVTPPSIYYGCSTWKTFWEEMFTLCDISGVNMKNMVVATLGNKDIPRVLKSTLTWTYRKRMAVR